MTDMIRQCVVCGCTFTAAPSSKKITCSAECSAIRKAQTHIGKRNIWSSEARAALSAQRKRDGLSDNARKGLNAAMAMPESQRGERHRAAKIWILIDPSGQRYRVVNLLDWARRHAHWFDVPADEADRERIARNVRSGFGQIVQSRLGHKRHPCYTYKGWTLGDWPREKPPD